MAEKSENLRRRGNEMFKQACETSDKCLAPVIRSQRFLKAGDLYNQALAASRTEDERAKCRKNLGAVYWRHAKISLELYEDGQASSLLHKREASSDLERSVKNYLAALRHGRASRQKREWMKSIEDTLQEMAESLVKEHSWVCESAFIAKLCDLYQAGLPSGAQSEAYDTLQLEHVRLLLDTALEELHRSDEAGSNYANCLSLLHSCNVPFEQIQRRAESDLETLEEARLLKLSVDECRARCESMKALEEGKRFMQEFKKSKDKDQRNHLLTCALDKFKEAAGHAKGVDVECEAEALACTGDAYTEIRRQERAQSYYLAVVRLAEKSNDVQEKEFYKKARARSRVDCNAQQLARVRLLLDTALKELHRRDEPVPGGLEYANCLSLLQSCNVALEQIQRRAESDRETLEQARLLKSSVDKCRARCASMKALEEGKRFIQEFKKTKDEDQRNHLLTCALDKFKEAEGYAKGVDAECEAEALACIGDAYTENRSEEKAQSYYLAVVRLAEKSDVVQRKGFYKRAKAAASAWRAAWVKRMREGRSGFHLLPEIRADLDKIQVEFKRLPTDKFLKYLYCSYPPRARNGTACTLGEIDTPDQIRIAVKKALLHYHPDHSGLDDDKYLALCNEITKLLVLRHKSCKD